MNNGQNAGIDAYHLPVFHLVDEDGAIGPDFFGEVAAGIARRGLRLLVLLLPGDGPGRSAAGVSGAPLRLPGIDCLDLAPASLAPAAVFSSETQLLSLLADLSERYDMILTAGGSGLPLNTLMVAAGTEKGRDGGGHVRSVDPARGIEGCAASLSDWLEDIWRQRPVWACVLIGGKSSRMGRPKHLIELGGGGTWLEATVSSLQPCVDGVVLSGAGSVPAALSGLPRMADVPGAAGPLAGILSAMRWLPGVSWLLVACDMPSLTAEAIRWLLDGRRPGRWAIIPRLQPDSHVEPLLAWYDCRCRPWFEELLLSGSLRIGEVAHRRQSHLPVIPEHHSTSWSNVNTPDELASLIEAIGQREKRGGYGH